MEVKKTQNSDGVVEDGGDIGSIEGYISPEVVSAMSGKTVTFNMDVNPPSEDDSDPDNA